MQDLAWTPRKEKGFPKYRQIIEYIRTKIARGEWPVGTVIPAQRILAHNFKVNRSTISTAIDELIADGLLEGSVGSGTQVINNTWSLMKPTLPLNWSHYTDSGLQQPNSPTMREINRMASHSDIIKLSKGESPKDFRTRQVSLPSLRKTPDQIFRNPRPPSSRFEGWRQLIRQSCDFLLAVQFPTGRAAADGLSDPQGK